MASVYPKKINGKTYYYLREMGWVAAGGAGVCLSFDGVIMFLLRSDRARVPGWATERAGSGSPF